MHLNVKNFFFFKKKKRNSWHIQNTKIVKFIIRDGEKGGPGGALVMSA
jgi:hypothetical protein